jgi:ribonuclease III
MSITKARRVQLKQLQKNISYSFKKLALLNQALLHKSFVNENPHHPLEDNERLEFLGDAVLDVIISHILMDNFPHYAEGDLTKLRSALVNDKRIADLARTLQLGDFLLLGKGEDSTKGRNKNSILADTYEAVIAAMYLDGGFKKVFTVVTKHFRDILTAANEGSLHHRDFKSQLQERTQSIFKATPHYILVKEVGPDHNKSFAVRVSVHKKVLGKGFGSTKKDAEQKAAQEALHKLESTHPINVD